MSGFLFYCKDCNYLLANSYDDDVIECDKCGNIMIPLHIDADSWYSLSKDEKRAILKKYRTAHDKNRLERSSGYKKDFTQSEYSYDDYTQKANRVDNPYKKHNSYSKSREIDYYNRYSQMSIIGFILSILGCTSLIGMILGIIDLTKTDGRKRGLSVASVIIGTIMLFVSIGVTMSNSEDSEKTSKEEATTATETQEYIYPDNEDKEIDNTAPVVYDSNNTESVGTENDIKHQILAKPSDGEILEVGRLYLHENPDEYTGKWVRFAGKIVGMNKESLQLDIEGPSALKNIYCNMMSDQDISQFDYDDYVTIVGKMDSKLIGQVMLNSCYVENSGDVSKELDEKLEAEYPVETSSGKIFGTPEIDKNTAIELTAEQAYKEYDENQVACKTKYDGKLIAMTGVIDDIGTNVLGQEYITFKTGDEWSINGVQCFFKDDQQDYVASLSKGQEITIYGYADMGSS